MLCNKLFDKSRVALLVVILAIGGCGSRVRPITGGTPGTLRSPEGPVGEMQINVFQKSAAGWESVGFGISAADGAFALFKNQATGPLELAPGEYRCTIETAGAPAQVAKDYMTVETTPLEIIWPTPTERLEIVAPIKIVP